VQHRAWLVHWSLFVYFNIPDGRNKFLEFVFNNEEYVIDALSSLHRRMGLTVVAFTCRILHAIPITCPHVLRYLAVAVLTMDRTIRRKNLTKELVRLVRQVRHLYEL